MIFFGIISVFLVVLAFFLKNFLGYLQFLVALCFLCVFLVIIGGFVWVLVVFGGSWWFLVYFSVLDSSLGLLVNHQEPPKTSKNHQQPK